MIPGWCTEIVKIGMSFSRGAVGRYRSRNVSEHLGKYLQLADMFQLPPRSCLNEMTIPNLKLCIISIVAVKVFCNELLELFRGFIFHIPFDGCCFYIKLKKIGSIPST